MKAEYYKGYRVHREYSTGTQQETKVAYDRRSRKYKPLPSAYQSNTRVGPGKYTCD